MSARNVSQAMQPRGLAGRIFGVLMERLSASNYAWVVGALKAHKPKSYLEIGFGTGKLLQLVARKLRPQKLVGIDPSELMVETARKRLRGPARKISIELKLGDDMLLETIDGPLDAIAATHSFQFWSDPEKTLARIHMILADNGLLVLVLRKHAAHSTTSSIPNPISKSGDELGGTRKALAMAGFHITTDEELKTGSHGIVAIKC